MKKLFIVVAVSFVIWWLWKRTKSAQLQALLAQQRGLPFK